MGWADPVAAESLPSPPATRLRPPPARRASRIPVRETSDPAGPRRQPRPPAVPAVGLAPGGPPPALPRQPPLRSDGHPTTPGLTSAVRDLPDRIGAHR